MREMISPANGNARQSVLLECICACLIILASMVTALLVYRNFIPWGDEAQFIDPAVNLAQGKGFVSSAWPYQHPNEFFLGNAPLYPFLNALWFKLAGFGLLQARVLNFALAGVAAFLIWLSVHSSNFLSSPVSRLAAVLLILGGFGVAFSYQSARYDALGMALAAACYFCICSDLMRGRNIALSILGALIPLAGFHLVVAFVLLVIVDFVAERKIRQEFFFLATGIALGLLILLGLAAYHGLLEKFLLITFGSQHTITGRLGKAVTTGDMKVVRGFLDGYRILFQDPSFSLVLLALLPALYIFRRGGKTAIAGGELLRAIGLVAIVPAGLFIIGKYPVYYSWIGYVPAVLFALRWAESASGSGMVSYRNFSFVLLFGALVVGFPQLLTSTIKANNGIDYDALEARVKAALRPGDIIYSDFSAYFAARSVSSPVFVETYGRTAIVNGIPEHDTITALVVRRDEIDSIRILIPGDWVELATNVAFPPVGNAEYSHSDVTVFRRR